VASNLVSSEPPNFPPVSDLNSGFDPFLGQRPGGQGWLSRLTDLCHHAKGHSIALNNRVSGPAPIDPCWARFRCRKTLTAPNWTRGPRLLVRSFSPSRSISPLRRPGCSPRLLCLRQQTDDLPPFRGFSGQVLCAPRLPC